MAREREEDEIREEGPRSFAVFMDRLADGRANEDASIELFKLGKAIQREIEHERKAKGELTVKFIFKADANGVVHISYEIKRKDPPTPTMPGVSWLTVDGNFVDQNPRQQSLPGIREVPPPRREVRDIGAPTGAPKEV